ncbi:hypothetical protein AAXE64_27275 [Priestia megaterium]
MGLIEAKKEKNQYTFVFKKDEQLISTSVEFKCLGHEGTDLLEEDDPDVFLRDIAYRVEDETELPFDIKQYLRVKAVHIPNTYMQLMFKTIIHYIAGKTALPISVSSASHPQYQLTTLTYNINYLTYEEVNSLINDVMLAMHNAEVITIENKAKEDEETVQVDDVLSNFDNLEGDQIIEYEFDPEVAKQLNKEPVEKIYPMESDEDAT